MKVIQIVPTLLYGDAVGNDVLAIDKTLKKGGYNTKVYAEHIDKKIPQDVAASFSKMPKIKNNDIILYHLASGADLNYKLPSLSGKKIIVYHNITPPRFFSDYNYKTWKYCKAGVDSVRFLSDKIDYCLADSEYNKKDLIKLGYTCPIIVLPVLIPFADYKKEPDRKVKELYSEDITNILFTGRIVPNKCQEDIIEAFYYYHKYYNNKSRLILVGNYIGMELYYNDLKRYVEKLGLSKNVVFTGHIRFEEILAYYHTADLFLCMSEHEGFCVPLVEAMCFNIPIIAYDSTAIANTLGGSGFLLKQKQPLETAGAINYILKNTDFKEALIEKQRERLQDFAHEKIEKQLLSFLNDIIKE